MIDFLTDILPTLAQALGLISVVFTGVCFVLIGRLAGCHKGLADTALLSGWGAVVLVYTAVATLSTLDLAVVAWAGVAAAVLAAIVLRRRGEALVAPGAWRVFALGAPFLLIVAAKYPSEVDVLSHWLYNALYLLDHGTLPRPGLPQSLSAYTGFPYNHTFVLHLVSVLIGRFAESAGFIVNFGLVILFAVLLARLIQSAQTESFEGDWPAVSWPLAALALILATYANPIFVRKIVLMANPDTATSVGLTFLGIVGWQLSERLRAGADRLAPWALQFGFLALLFINMKQPNLVILLILFAVMAGLVVFGGGVGAARRLLVWTPLLLGPALLSYLLWRGFLSSAAQLHEATLLPFAQWQFENIPAILRSLWANVVKKAGYFGIMFVLTGWAAWRLFRARTPFDRLAILVAGLFLGWNGFLFFLYFAHWTGHASTGASSYWRYNTFIGYFGYAVAVYGIARLYFQGHLQLLLARVRIPERRLGQGVVAIALAMPIVTAPYLRFDREQPKPFLREIGDALGPTLPTDSRLLVHIPGDVGDYATVMQYFANRFRPNISVAPAPTLRIIKGDLAKPYPRLPMVWAMCGNAALEGFFGLAIPAKKSVLLARKDGTWRIEKSWPWPTPGLFSRYHKNVKRTRCDITG